MPHPSTMPQHITPSVQFIELNRLANLRKPVQLLWSLLSGRNSLSVNSLVMVSKTCQVTPTTQLPWLVFDNYAVTVTPWFYTLGLFDTAGQETAVTDHAPSAVSSDRRLLACFSVDITSPLRTPEKISHHCPRTPFLLVGTQVGSER
ncbi:cell division control protein 42 homolog [Lates japonicus]|uniref:Cell division control protein 42 homolog n=1 Tax=Lates japonicus TaxID=270547 RepID=A0AAD3NLD1_LATJO|nr:cell division control protein 42 homolog [Lates japonicus]